MKCFLWVEHILMLYFYTRHIFKTLNESVSVHMPKTNY